MKSNEQINTDTKKPVNEDKLPSGSNTECDEKKANNKIKELLSCVPISFSRCSKVAFVIYLAFIIAAMIIIPILIRVCYPLIKEWFSISDGYDAAYLTSTILIAVVTVIYVVFTYFIFVATNKNTQQTANAQKIALLERKLENFYVPMQSALKEFGRNKTIETLSKKFQGDGKKRDVTSANDRNELRKSLLPIAEKWWDFKDDYDKIDPYTHLASEEVLILLGNFTGIFDEFPRRYDSEYENTKQGEQCPEYSMDSLINSGGMIRYLQNVEQLFEYLEALESALETDITYTKKKLSELVKV